MDMQVNKQRIKAERERRAWSQNQLAEVANLSIRTVQRVERSGAASYETIQSLASAFNLRVDELQSTPISYQSNRTARQKVTHIVGSGLVGVVATLLSILIYTTVQAQEILLDIDYTTSSKHSTPFSMADDLDQEMEFSVGKDFRVTITPTLTKSQNILLTFNIYQRLDNEYQLISQPKIITGNQQQAEIIVNHRKTDELAVRITPHYGLL